MDDIDTRLQAERPDVADALRSMNWEERLEKARARRNAVLKNPENSGKRPVVRVVDAAAMAQRRSGAQVPASATTSKAQAALEASVVVPLRPAAPPTVAPHEASSPMDAKPSTDRRSLAGRTALGFGLGLGLGTSLLAGAFLLFAGPFAPAALTPDVTTPGAPEPVGMAQAAAPGPALPPTVGPPAMPAITLTELLAPTAPIDAAAPPASVALAPDRRPAPFMAASPEADGPVRPPVPLTAPDGVVVDIALSTIAAPAGVAAVTLPEPNAVSPRVTRPTLARIVSSDPYTVSEASLPRPTENVAPTALTPSLPAASLIRLPDRVAMPLQVSLPTRPGSLTLPERSPAAITAPPDLPPRLSGTEDMPIPNGASLFVRIAAPETVPDAEAEELAALIQEVGIGEGRVGRVGFKVSETHLRFYHQQDAAAAAALGEVIGTEVRDFTSFRPRPPEGTLEIFLAGEGTSPPPRAVAPTRARQQPPDDLTRMRDRIVNRLRRGEHL